MCSTTVFNMFYLKRTHSIPEENTFKSNKVGIHVLYSQNDAEEMGKANPVKYLSGGERSFATYLPPQHPLSHLRTRLLSYNHALSLSLPLSFYASFAPPRPSRCLPSASACSRDEDRCSLACIRVHMAAYAWCLLSRRRRRLPFWPWTSLTCSWTSATAKFHS